MRACSSSLVVSIASFDLYLFSWYRVIFNCKTARSVAVIFCEVVCAFEEEEHMLDVYEVYYVCRIKRGKGEIEIGSKEDGVGLGN